MGDVLRDNWRADPDLLGSIPRERDRTDSRAGGAPVSRESRALALFARGGALFLQKAPALLRLKTGPGFHIRARAFLAAVNNDVTTMQPVIQR